jgi:hypothetical protein
VATGTVILRYRLYDLDRIISRTLAWTLLTLLLGLGHAAVALRLGRLLGRDSSLVVAAAASRAWWTAASAVAAMTPPARSPRSATGSKASGPPSGWSTCRCMRRG